MINCFIRNSLSFFIIFENKIEMAPTMFKSPRRIKHNLEMYGSPNTPEEDKVYWKGVNQEYNDWMVGLVPDPSKPHVKNLNWEEELYRSDPSPRNIVRPPSLDTFWRKPNQFKRKYSVDKLKALLQEEINSRTS